jgi:general secretion pathway protein L
LLFADESGAPGRWLLLDESGVQARGEIATERPSGWSKAILAVPGEQVTVHWLELSEGLTLPQASAAARLMLADVSAEPLAEMHVAVGRAENGLTPVALAASRQMAAWLDLAIGSGVDPEIIVPMPMLLQPPEQGFVCRELGQVSDYRGPAAAFALEPELAEAMIAGALCSSIDRADFEAGLPTVLAMPQLNLRQTAFARRRQWKLQAPRMRRVAMLALAFALLSLVVQVAEILSYTFAADRIQAEADAMAAQAPGRADSAPGFGVAASVLFDAVRATPNVELARIDYRRDGSLVATVMLDNPATLSVLQSRIEAGGMRVEPGVPRNAGGRPAADLTVGPA